MKLAMYTVLNTAKIDGMMRPRGNQNTNAGDDRGQLTFSEPSSMSVLPMPKW